MGWTTRREAHRPCGDTGGQWPRWIMATQLCQRSYLAGYPLECCPVAPELGGGGGTGGDILCRAVSELASMGQVPTAKVPRDSRREAWEASKHVGSPEIWGRVCHAGADDDGSLPGIYRSRAEMQRKLACDRWMSAAVSRSRGAQPAGVARTPMGIGGTAMLG